jgi:hypothetical protein
VYFQEDESSQTLAVVRNWAEITTVATVLVVHSNYYRFSGFGEK